MNGLPRWTKQLGLPGLLGVAALLLSALTLLLGQHWDAEASRLQVEARELRSRVRPVAIIPAPVDSQQWQASIPAASQRQQRLAGLLELAIRLDLNTVRTEHRLASADGLERLRVTMPVTGPYAQVRRFIAAALTQDPALSLDAVRLRRGNPMATEVEAELQWSLHSRALP